MAKKLSSKRAGKDIRWAQQIIATVSGFRAARVLMAACRTGVFERLARGGASSAGLAVELKLDADMLERVLIACAAMDLVRRQGGEWELADKGRVTLAPDSPLFQGNYIAHMMGVWDFWNDLERVLRNEPGASLYSPDATRHRSHRDFILAMHNLAVAGRAADLSFRVDLTGKRTLLDVGGGPGTYAMMLCRRFPELHATIFDLPETVAIAREVIAEHGMADRVSLRAGNWDADDFGSNVDVVLMSNVLHGSTSAAEAKLAKAFQAMNPNGVLILQDFLLNRDKTGPLLPALFNIMVGAFSVDELVERVAAAGFAQIKNEEMHWESGQTLIAAVKPAEMPGTMLPDV